MAGRYVVYRVEQVYQDILRIEVDRFDTSEAAQDKVDQYQQLAAWDADNALYYTWEAEDE